LLGSAEAPKGAKNDPAGSQDRPGPKAVISVSPLAAAKMREYMHARGKTGKALRIWLKGLGRRISYGMAFDDARPGDVQVVCNGFTIVLDPVSAAVFDGARLLWVETGACGPGFALEMPNLLGAAGEASRTADSDSGVTGS